MNAPVLERVVISVVFGLAGVAKLLALEFESEAFHRWGYPAGFMYFIGVLEAAGAIGLWLRKLAPFVALCLAGLACGALLTRIVFGEWLMTAATAALLAVTIHYTWRRRAELLPSDPPLER